MNLSKLKSVDGRMSAEEYSFTIDLLGLKTGEAGTWLNISPRQSFRYVAGEVPVPPPIGKLLTLMLRLRLKPHQV